MGRRPAGDRAWVREVKVRGERRFQLVVVRRTRSGGPGEKTTTTFARKGEADRALAVVRAALDAGTVDAPLTWQEAVDWYDEHRAKQGDRERSRETEGYRLGAVGKTLDNPDPLTLRAEDAARHIAARLDAGISPTTINAELAAVKSLQAAMVAEGWIERATWRDVRKLEAVPEKAHLMPHEIGRFLRAAVRLAERPPGKSVGKGRARKEDWARWPAAAVLLMHGLRTGELVRLRVGDMDLVNGIVYIRDRAGARTKTRASVRPVPIQTIAGLRVLRETYRDVAPAEPAFSSRRGPLTPRTKWFLYRAHLTCQAAEVTDVPTHGLRHSTATAVLGLGDVDTWGVSRLLGHSDARVTEAAYNHAAVGQALGAARALGGFLDRAWNPDPGLRVVEGAEEDAEPSTDTGQQPVNNDERPRRASRKPQ